MGANRTAASPEAYPAAFLAAVRSGSSVLYADDLPWSILSSAKRFRLLLALLRSLPDHPLHTQAKRRWKVEPSPQALVISVYNFSRGEVPSPIPMLIARALR
jgi:hypothetical protein